MTEKDKLKLGIGFTSLYGIHLLANLDMHMDADHFNVTSHNVGAYLDGYIEHVADEARQAGELHFIRPMFEFLIACSRDEIKALQIGDVQNWGDVTFGGAVICGMSDDEWKLIFEYTRQRLFGLPPMTDDEKRKVKEEVTIIDESLDDFRARMRAEGRLPAP